MRRLYRSGNQFVVLVPDIGKVHLLALSLSDALKSYESRYGVIMLLIPGII